MIEPPGCLRSFCPLRARRTPLSPGLASAYHAAMTQRDTWFEEALVVGSLLAPEGAAAYDTAMRLVGLGGARRPRPAVARRPR